MDRPLTQIKNTERRMIFYVCQSCEHKWDDDDPYGFICPECYAMNTIEHGQAVCRKANPVEASDDL